MSCPFCERIANGNVTHATQLSAALLDGFPLNPGHTLVVPRQHEADLYALSEEQQLDVWMLAGRVRRDLGASHGPDGFNVGLNLGAAGGQTIGHAHVHVIPRFAGDVPDPRGGVRWVVPARAAYWIDQSDRG